MISPRGIYIPLLSPSFLQITQLGPRLHHGVAKPVLVIPCANSIDAFP